MERTEVCLICERQDPARLLGVWIVNGERWPVHTECWIDAYRSSRLPARPARLSA